MNKRILLGDDNKRVSENSISAFIDASDGKAVKSLSKKELEDAVTEFLKERGAIKNGLVSRKVKKTQK